MQIINMMPYDIHVYGMCSVEDGPVFSYPKSGKVAHISSEELGTMQGPDVWYEEVQYGELEDFPVKKTDVLYIVSLVAAIAGRSRGDLLSPYKKVRDKEQMIVGCRYLQKVR